MINAVVTRNRELLSISGSRVRAAAGVARGETPLAILFFFEGKEWTFRGVFFIDVIYFTKWPQYHPLAEEGRYGEVGGLMRGMARLRKNCSK